MAYPSTPRDANNIPIGCVYVPGVGFVALQGGTSVNTDGNGNQSAAVAVSGTVTATSAANGTNGSVAPSTSTQIGASDGTNLQALQVESSSNKNLRTAIYQGANEVTVTQFHSADNQNLGSGNGLLTGGVAQILNPAGTLDRQRGTGIDSIPAVGVATGTQQLAGPKLSTTFNGAVTGSANAQTITVASTASMQVGDIITTSDNIESAEVITVPTGTTFTAILKNNHANSATLSWYHYNQARDATIGDNVAGTGLSPNATFLYNNITGNFEYDRSANGEKDGANGFGTAVAAEYEWNGGGPLNNSSVISGLQFDRARNLQGKGLGSGTISNNPLAAGSTTLTLNSAPTTLQPGQQIILDRAGANPEANYVSTSYTAGSTSVALQNATAFSHAQNSTVEWDQFAALGPQLNGFTAAGIGIEEEALYNPVDGKFYVERSATADGMAGANVVAESPALWNGSTFDRLKGDNTGAARVSLYGKNSSAGDTAVSVDSSGRLNVDITQIGGVNTTMASADGVAAANVIEFVPGQINSGGTVDRVKSPNNIGDGGNAGLSTAVVYNYNDNTGYDRQRGNTDGITLLASAARTTTQTGADQTNYNGRGVIVVLDMTNAGTGSVTLEIDGKDPVSGKYYAILTGAAVTTNSTNIYRVYPGLTAAANATANDVLPRTWRIKVTANNANSATYSVGAMIQV